MWGRHMLIVLLPSTLALASLGTSLCSAISNNVNPSCAAATSLSLVAELSLFRNDPQNLPAWFFPIGIASFSISSGVNAIVAGLLCLKLIAVHREVTHSLPALSLRSNLLPMTSLLLETGVFLFMGQLVFVVLFGLQNPGFNSIGSPMIMIYVRYD